MQKLSNSQRIIVGIISALVQTGVPMTPWAGTWLGYLLISIAGFLSLYIFFTWITAESSVTESLVASPSISKSLGARVSLLIPSVLLIVMAAVWSYFGGLPALSQSVSDSGNTSVSIACTPVMLPIRSNPGDSIYSVSLHSRWGDGIIKAIIGSDDPFWPSEQTSGAAFKCVITNSGKADILGLTLPFHIDYKAHEASPQSRTAVIVLPDIIEQGKSFVFHIVNDTIRYPEVTLPEHVYGRVRGDVKSRDILVEYSTRDGAPTKLSGFGAQ
jgi:hypothetical protein